MASSTLGSETDQNVGSIEITKSESWLKTVNRIPGPNNNNNNNNSGKSPLSNAGVFLTWQDLWVTISSGKNSKRAILQGLTGYAKPGEVLAIMGPSGCGKSTLLDALAGRLSSNTRQSGEIFINGRKQTLAYGTSAYVTQDDTLITTLTVAEAVNYSAQLQLPDSMSWAEKRERAEEAVREMGLQDAANTRIGGWGAKGLSGGQKRRVSICIEILTHPNLLFLDEPTSGLDSAASFYVMRGIAALDATGNARTIVASIHQPSSEVFQLFHSLCLLSAGKTVYFGPASQANEFFTSSGFPCPTLQNPSDHFLKTINKDFEQDIEQGLGIGAATTVDEAIDHLIQSYKASDCYQEIKKQVADIHKQEYEAMLETKRKRSRASFPTQCVVLTQRSFKNMYRDLGYYWLRMVVYVSLAVGIGTIFYHVGSTYASIQARGALIMFVTSFLTFMAIGGFPSFVEDMKVFERERLNGHYSVTSFVISNTISAQPYLFLISIIPGALAYYLPGLQNDYKHFTYFVLVLYACMMLVESLMMIVASLVPNYLMGIISGAGIQGLMMLGSGYFRLPNDLPNQFWRYPLYYIAFHHYAYQGLFKNEFEGLVFHSGRDLITEEEILKGKFELDLSYSKWVDLAILLGMVVFYRVLFLVIIKAAEKLKNARAAFTAVILPRKQSIQIMEINPIATPMH